MERPECISEHVINEYMYFELPNGVQQLKQTDLEAGMSSQLYYEDIELGKTWISPSRTITETDVVNFAAMTGDFNPLHVDQEYAASTPYGQRVAHGILGLAWVAGLASGYPHVSTSAFIGIRSWDFLRPLFFTDTVHVETAAIEKETPGRRNGRVKWKLKLINQRDEVTQQGVFETLVTLKNVVPRPHIAKSVANKLETNDAPVSKPEQNQ